MSDRMIPDSSEPQANDPSSATDKPVSERQIAEELRLRPTLPGVTRLSRKVPIGLGAAASVGIAGALTVGLHSRDTANSPSELHSTDHVAQADGLSQLPGDYSGLARDVPKLGPPLPGDLGQPILNARSREQASLPPIPDEPGSLRSTAPAIDPAIQRSIQEREAARRSQLFSEVQSKLAASAPSEAVATAPTTTTSSEAPEALSRAEAFLVREGGHQTTAADRLRPPANPYVLQAGAVIPAALITGLRSDLPGQITAQVTSPVYDSPTGRHLLIPQGSRLIGQYDAEVRTGQQRVLLVWNRLILPGGRSIVLERQPGADASGYAGLQDRVDNHWGRLFRAGILSTFLGIGAELGASGNNGIVSAIRRGVQDSVGNAGQEVVQQQLAVRPTLTIRPGYPVRVIVTRDLVLEPDGEAR